MAHGTQDQERVSVAPSSRAGLWALAVLLGVVAVLVELLGIVIVWLTSVDSAGSTYLEGLATIGVVAGLFLGGAVILALAARKRRRPTTGVMVGVAVASLLAAQAVLFVTGELGEDAGVRQDAAEAKACSPAEISLLLEIREDVFLAEGWLQKDIPPADVHVIGNMARADGSCVMSMEGSSIGVLIGAMDDAGWTLVQQAGGSYTLDRAGQRVQLSPDDQGFGYAAEVLP